MQKKPFAELNIKILCSTNLRSLIFNQKQVTREQLRSHLFFKAEILNYLGRKYSCSYLRDFLNNACYIDTVTDMLRVVLGQIFLSMCSVLMMSTGELAVRCMQLACLVD